ncbi:hypothetical protein PMIN03_010572 [Paraphaeosphaeria minitans]
MQTSADGWSAQRLQPNDKQAQRVLTKSGLYWNTLLVSAASTAEYPACCFRVHDLLNQTPALPSHPDVLEYAGNTLCLAGFSEWDISRPSGCSLESTTKRSRAQKTTIGLPEPTFCQLSKVNLPARRYRYETDTSTNFLAAFILGWSYVFSARLVELRGHTADQVTYTGLLATVCVRDNGTQEHCALQLGELSETELQWWQAILAPGCGWQAVLRRSDRRYHPPWSCHLNRDETFKINCSMQVSSPATCRPPKSKEAQQYLSAFARKNDGYDQFLIALTACLTLPPQGRLGAPIVLPHPRAAHHRSSKRFPNRVDESQIPHYMALSLIPNAVSSAMLGCFLEPGLECVFASEWICPAQKLIESTQEEDLFQTVVKMMALHRPTSAPLWIGAANTGLSTQILHMAYTDMPPISLEATVWTKCMQSFMDPENYNRAPLQTLASNGKVYIPRQDEMRLLYIIDVESRRYPSPPLGPWPPPGTVELRDTSLEVKQHLKCAHRPLYKQWNWQLAKERILFDPGLTVGNERTEAGPGLAVVKTVPQRLRRNFRRFVSQFTQKSSRSFETTEHNVGCDKALSRSATRCAFRWILPDGIKSDDQDLWKDEWLVDLLNDDAWVGSL